LLEVLGREAAVAQGASVLIAPQGISTESAADSLDGFLLKESYSGCLPLMGLDQRDTLGAKTQGFSETLVECQQVFVLKEAGWVFPSARPELVPWFYAQGLESPRNGTGAAAAYTEHDDGTLLGGSLGEFSWMIEAHGFLR
jgi:hypothetical protein